MKRSAMHSGRGQQIYRDIAATQAVSNWQMEQRGLAQSPTWKIDVDGVKQVGAFDVFTRDETHFGLFEEQVQES